MPDSIPDDLRLRLADRVRRGNLPTILVLPSAVRDGQSYYSEFDMEAVQNSRGAGVDAQFLDVENRRYLSEYSAGVLLAFVLSVAQDLTVDGLKAVGTFLLAQLRSAESEGLVERSDEVSLKVDVARVRIDRDGIELDDVHVQAQGGEAIKALLPLLGAQEAAAEALRQLELRPGSQSE